jgi:hypothetical protein
MPKRLFVPRSAQAMLFPLGKEGKLVSQQELYMAMLDFDRKRIAEVTEPFLVVAQDLRNALGSDSLSYSNTNTE